MIAADTNILVRFLVRDDPAQAALALRLITEHPIWISKTVLLETAWVLRATYGYKRLAAHQGITSLLGIPSVEVEARGEVMRALQWVEAGLDFADALHLAATPSSGEFVTFDRELAKTAAKLPDAPEVRLLTL